MSRGCRGPAEPAGHVLLLGAAAGPDDAAAEPEADATEPDAKADATEPDDAAAEPDDAAAEPDDAATEPDADDAARAPRRGGVLGIRFANAAGATTLLDEPGRGRSIFLGLGAGAGGIILGAGAGGIILGGAISPSSSSCGGSPP